MTEPMTECPNCEMFYRGDRCPTCGFNPRMLDADPGPPTPPKDTPRWLCRARPENGLPCSIPSCDHPGSQIGDRPSREQVRKLVTDLAATLAFK